MRKPRAGLDTNQDSLVNQGKKIIAEYELQYRSSELYPNDLHNNSTMK